MTFLKTTIFLLFALATSACSTVYENPHLQLMSENEIHSIIDKNTVRKRMYDGFQNTMEVSITLHNSEVLRAILDMEARMFQWNPEHYNLEKSKIEADKNTKTDYFLSFFVPEKTYDDLAKKTTSWKIFMDINGRRVEGRVSKVKKSYAELRAVYPHYTKWNTPYKISFPIATADADNQPAVVTLTGPVGSVQTEFKK